MFHKPIFPVLTKAFFHLRSRSPHIIIFVAFGADNNEVTNESSVKRAGGALDGTNCHEDRFRAHSGFYLDSLNDPQGGPVARCAGMDLWKRTPFSSRVAGLVIWRLSYTWPISAAVPWRSEVCLVRSSPAGPVCQRAGPWLVAGEQYWSQLR